MRTNRQAVCTASDAVVLSVRVNLRIVPSYYDDDGIRGRL